MPSDNVQANAQSPTQRILSVDALRGFDMFWIVGGSGVVGAILPFCGSNVQKLLEPQLEHAAWEGFTLTDLIFPLFVFMVGMTTVFSLSKTVAQQGKATAYQRLFRRAALLFLLGIFYSGGLTKAWPDIRLLGVLQRIALCYLFTGILFIHLRTRGLAIVAAALLLVYWAWLSFVPVPGLGKVSFDPGTNWSNYLDSKYLPGRKYDGEWDPEGYLSTLPAIVTCLFGVFAAQLLKNQRFSEGRKIAYLLGAGVLALVVGYAWGLQFPIIKKIWTSSYVLVAGGYSFLLLGLFYTVIDVWKLQRWATPFVWIGMNAITLYMAENMIDFEGLARRLVGGDIQTLAGSTVGPLLHALAAFGMVLALAYLLYRHKIFLRV